jgi:pyrimidine-specific ribonucleoside hydrolase
MWSRRSVVTMLALLAVVLAACDSSPGSVAPPPSSSPATNDEVTHVVFDTDLAFDDIMALLYLGQRDDVVIDAVTLTGTGEAHCDPGVENALRLLALGGNLETPVACGRETPLQGTNAFPDEWRAAVDNLSMLGLPPTDRAADPRGAVRLLQDTLDGDATLITLGPLTNVAEALRSDPNLAERVPAFVAMAGAIDVPGNTPTGVAEYNVWVDPLAAKEVIEGMDVALVPLDATDDVPFTPFFADTLADHLSSPEAEAVDAIIRANQGIFLEGGYSFWDTLATALVLRPELATWDEARVVVTASQDAGAGWIDRWDEGIPVDFASSVPDPLAFEREYLSVLTGETVTEVRPDPTVAITFDGERCSIAPDHLSAGTEVVSFEGPDAPVPPVGVMASLTDLTYEELRRFVGADGSLLAPDAEPPAGLEVIGFVQDLAEVQTAPSTVVAICATQRVPDGPARAWLSAPVEVSP